MTYHDLMRDVNPVREKRLATEAAKAAEAEAAWNASGREKLQAIIDAMQAMMSTARAKPKPTD